MDLIWIHLFVGASLLSWLIFDLVSCFCCTAWFFNPVSVYKDLSIVVTTLWELLLIHFRSQKFGIPQDNWVGLFTGLYPYDRFDSLWMQLCIGGQNGEMTETGLIMLAYVSLTE